MDSLHPYRRAEDGHVIGTNAVLRVVHTRSPYGFQLLQVLDESVYLFGTDVRRLIFVRLRQPAWNWLGLRAPRMWAQMWQEERWRTSAC